MATFILDPVSKMKSSFYKIPPVNWEVFVGGIVGSQRENLGLALNLF